MSDLLKSISNSFHDYWYGRQPENDRTISNDKSCLDEIPTIKMEDDIDEIEIIDIDQKKIETEDKNKSWFTWKKVAICSLTALITIGASFAAYQAFPGGSNINQQSPGTVVKQPPSTASQNKGDVYNQKSWFDTIFNIFSGWDNAESAKTTNSSAANSLDSENTLDSSAWSWVTSWYNGLPSIFGNTGSAEVSPFSNARNEDLSWDWTVDSDSRGELHNGAVSARLFDSAWGLINSFKSFIISSGTEVYDVFKQDNPEVITNLQKSQKGFLSEMDISDIGKTIYSGVFSVAGDVRDAWQGIFSTSWAWSPFSSNDANLGSSNTETCIFNGIDCIKNNGQDNPEVITNVPEYLKGFWSKMDISDIGSTLYSGFSSVAGDMRDALQNIFSKQEQTSWACSPTDTGFLSYLNLFSYFYSQENSDTGFIDSAKDKVCDYLDSAGSIASQAKETYTEFKNNNSDVASNFEDSQKGLWTKVNVSDIAKWLNDLRESRGFWPFSQIGVQSPHGNNSKLIDCRTTTQLSYENLPVIPESCSDSHNDLGNYSFSYCSSDPVEVLSSNNYTHYNNETSAGIANPLQVSLKGQDDYNNLIEMISDSGQSVWNFLKNGWNSVRRSDMLSAQSSSVSKLLKNTLNPK